MLNNLYFCVHNANLPIMRHFKLLLTAICAVIFFTQCDAFKSVSSKKVGAQGAPYELIVVCNQPEWESPLGDTLRTIFGAYIPNLNQEEPLFTILRVTNQGYDNLVPLHHNILEVNVKPEIKEPALTVRYDVKAAPQIVVTLQGPDTKSVTDYISENRESVVQVLEMAERDRDVKYAQQFSVESIDKLIFDTFGVEMKVPQGYTVRSEAEDFLWISYEYALASQGFMLYSYPAEFGVNSLSAEMLIDARNKYAANIPGPSDGSYMITYEEFAPSYRPFRLDGRLWVEMYGFWDVANDFMGGPYVSYSTIDTATNRVFTLDCYVYSPKLPKRNYMRGLEHLLYNVKFPAGENK